MFKETVTHVHHWSDRTFSFRCTRAPEFNFKAGEFVLIGIMHEGRPIMRAYSMVSPPQDTELEFLSIKIANGKLTSLLQHIKTGDQVIVGRKPTGTLINESLTPGGDLWLLSTGTGLAPFMSLVQDQATLAMWNRIHLVHSVSDDKDLAYRSELSTNPAINYYPVVTGAGDARITTQLVSGQLPVDTSQDKIMLCGSIPFNKEIMTWCKARGMKEGALHDPGQYVVERAFVTR